MITKYSLLGVILLCPSVLTQSELRADVSFTDTNDRYDLTDMMMDKNMFPEANVVQQEDGIDETEFRRRLQNEKTPEPQLDILKINPDSIFMTRRSENGFAYEDKMDSAEGGSLPDFEENLKHFQTAIDNHRRNNQKYPGNLRGLGIYRKNNGADPENKILMHHAVPIVMQVDGYLKAPI